MRISYNNCIDSLPISAMTATSILIDYPLSNIQDQRLSMTMRSTAVSAFSITIDASALTDVPINTFALLGHNLSSAATIVLDMNIENSWPGVTSQTVTWNSDVILKFFTTIDTDADYILTESGDYLITEDSYFIVSEFGGYNWFQIRISDPSNTDGYIELGRVWLGDYLTISPSSLLDFKVTKKRSDIVMYGRGRQKFATKGVGWRLFDFNFPVTENTMIEKIITMYETVGNYKSFLFMNFDDILGYKLVAPVYCSINGELALQHDSNMRFSYSLQLEEDL